jgi:hypothetical protein
VDPTEQSAVSKKVGLLRLYTFSGRTRSARAAKGTRVQSEDTQVQGEIIMSCEWRFSLFHVGRVSVCGLEPYAVCFHVLVLRLMKCFECDILGDKRDNDHRCSSRYTVKSRLWRIYKRVCKLSARSQRASCVHQRTCRFVCMTLTVPPYHLPFGSRT